MSAQDFRHCERSEAIQYADTDAGLLRRFASRNDDDVSKLPAARLLALIGLTLALAYLIFLAGAYLNGDFLIDAQGRPIANDFVSVFAAGRLALENDPAAAYDWTVHKAAEVRAVGHDFANYYGWHYPPTFLFVAAALALPPCLAASAAWLLLTLAAYAAIVGRIVGTRAGGWFALGFPAAFWNVTAGQNSFLTAALIGGTLALLERHPTLAGVCLGLLSYKPQFGLLFPVVLIADRRWRTLAVAAAVAIALAALSLMAFGSANWQAFMQWLPVTGRVVLGEGGADFSRLQSLFGLVRAHGGSETLAWTVQGTATVALAVFLIWLWRSRAPFDLKAAALAAGALLATPYLYIYDLAALSVAVAFLLRYALQRGFTTADIPGLVCAGALILSYPFLTTQVGLAATLIVLALVLQRVLSERTYPSFRIAA